MAPRSDAVVNRDRIVEAARAALRDSNGAADELKLQLVAKTAGVGQGTLYRHFPTREHLLAEVYRQELTELVAEVDPLLAEHTPIEALTQWLHRLVGYARVKRGVMAAIEASAWRDLYADQHQRLDEAVQRLVSAGQAADQLRAGVDATDLILLLGALSRIPQSEFDARSTVVVAVIVDGLRTSAR